MRLYKRKSKLIETARMVSGWFMVAATVMIPFIVVAGYLKNPLVLP